jgi:hypothetical protein
VTASLVTVPIPVSDPIARPRSARGRGQDDPFVRRIAEGVRFDLPEPWLAYFTQQALVVSQAAVRIQSESLTAQAASIGATDFSGGDLAAGVYRLSYYMRITQAATTSSSLEIVLDWTDGSQTPSFAGAALTGNLLTTYQTGSLLIHVDASSPVRYATTYASVGATAMQYRLDLTLEQVNA